MPGVAIISVGADNSLAHLDELAVKKLDGMPIYRADQHGSIELVGMARATG